jgi:crossover junction endodeoxyribonuclease RusA
MCLDELLTKPNSGVAAKETMTIELPFPPSINHYWRTFRGRHCISQGGKDYTTDVQAALWSVDWRLMRGRLAVDVDAVMPDRRRRDIDNLLKVLLDALTKANAWEDDEQIDDLRIRRVGVESPGRVIVTVKPLTT